MSDSEKCQSWVGDDDVPLNPIWMNCTRKDCPRMRVELNRLSIDKEVRP